MILGGGYVGLRTALELKRREPSCDVVVLEQDICGGGASGRNGGLVLSWWSKLSSLAKLFGGADALRIARDSEAGIDEIPSFCEAHRIDAQFRRGGWLWTATSESQMGAWEGVVSLCEKLGVEPFRRLSPDEIARRTGSPVHRAGVHDASAATVQPAALARGLRRVALESGVRIHENTRVESFGRARPAVVRCAGGTVTADKLVVATNAWAAGIRELSRSIVAISSDMVVTAPAPERLRSLGWTGGECITDSQMMVDYYHATAAGRIAFGKGGWGIALSGHIGPRFDRDEDRSRKVVEDLRRTYPTLRRHPRHPRLVRPDRPHHQQPPAARPSRRAPAHRLWRRVERERRGPERLGGRILASLVLEADDDWGRYPLVDRRAGLFPPEPVRFVGAHVVRAAVASKERAEIRGRKPSRLAVAFSRLAPAGLEDKT